MASAFRGNFTALFVETPSFQVMNEKDKDQLRANIRLAQQLGATIETVYGLSLIHISLSDFSLFPFKKLADVLLILSD